MFDNGNIIKLSDFGTTRNLTQNSMSQKGTLMYMAPELKAENKHFNEKVDTYGFGLVIWEFITQLRPFEMFNDEFLIPTSSIPGEPEDLVNLMVEMLHHEPKERPRMAKIIEKLAEISDTQNEGNMIRKYCKTNKRY